jgi:hypothetical protein
MCGADREAALAWLAALEEATRPPPVALVIGRGQRP